MLNMIKVELTKLRKRRMTWILLVVMVAFYCLSFFGMYVENAIFGHELPNNVCFGVFGICVLFSPIMALMEEE